ncbi:MAG TPA: Dabb family protein [Caldithrix abyssi]|uniref:Dabb family protein n=1 Tax=Caldithrix abyssi TaxID=187145 RepID=A0A7V1PWJ8_CALAY|nr:Dabb family protein [Caldithrix abyssi]
MICHVVMWDIKKDVTPPVSAHQIKANLESLKEKIGEIVSFEVGINEREVPAGADIVLISRFKTFEDLKHYQEHPAHLEVVAFLRGCTVKKGVVDFTIDADSFLSS